MTKHFERDIEILLQELLAMSGAVEQMVAKASRALRDRDGELAREVVESERDVDLREVKIEEDCLKILALHQPVAIDLRRVATVLKVNGDLERIADLAKNTARCAKRLARFPDFPIPGAIEQMQQVATEMVRAALDAFVDLDVRAAKRVCRRDDDLDQLNGQVIDDLVDLIQRMPERSLAALQCYSSARHLERIGDHATNIAEDVIYMVDGEIVRHQPRNVYMSEETVG